MGSADHAVSSNVHPLRQVRILVAARDRRFVAAATFVLTRRGYVVESTRPSDLLGTVERTSPHVVVLDGSEALAPAGRTAAAIEGNYPSTRVLLVSENNHHSGSTLPKWEAFARLIQEIERVYGTPTAAREAL